MSGHPAFCVCGTSWYGKSVGVAVASRGARRYFLRATKWGEGDEWGRPAGPP